MGCSTCLCTFQTPCSSCRRKASGAVRCSMSTSEFVCSTAVDCRRVLLTFVSMVTSGLRRANSRVTFSRKVLFVAIWGKIIFPCALYYLSQVAFWCVGTWSSPPKPPKAVSPSDCGGLWSRSLTVVSLPSQVPRASGCKQQVPSQDGAAELCSCAE